MSSLPNVVYEFGPFRLDPAESRLSRDGVPVPLTPKAFETLVVLVSRAGRLVDKAELRREVWPDTVVEESSLSQHVYLVRKALGDERGDARVIETVPKRGYRFTAPVSVIVPPAVIEEPARPVEPPARPAPPAVEWRPAEPAPVAPSVAGRPWARAAAAAVLVAVFGAARTFGPGASTPDAPAPVAVDGVATAVRSPEAARAPAAAEAEAAPASLRVEAYDAYMLGLRFWNQRTDTGVREAIRHFEQAVQIAPRFAPAHAALADAYGLAAALRYGDLTQDEGYRRARRSATRALEIDPRLAAAHTALALVLQNDGQRVEAEREFKLALDLNPRSATALQRYARLMLGEGRLSSAIEVTERALALDPLSPALNSNLCYLLYLGRFYGRAGSYCRKAAELEPNLAQPLITLALIEIQSRRFDRARSWLARAEARATGVARLEVIAVQGYVHAVTGRRDLARASLAELQRLTAGHDPRRIARLGIHAALGETERAIDLLRSCAQDPQRFTVEVVAFDPRYDDLRRDPRVAQVISSGTGDSSWVSGGLGEHRAASTVD
jgi:DNA-binding winged helix-turn-helix (wHTH) protein/Tfp pilus assembly protein PilF